VRIGLPAELLHVPWMSELKACVEQMAPDLTWVHRATGREIRPQFLGEDACYPFKRMVGSSLSLCPEVDHLLLPRIVGLDGLFTCPNFRALPDIVRLNAERTPETRGSDVVAPLMEITTGKDVLALARDLAGGFRARPSSLPGPLRAPWPETTPDQDLSRTILLIGHPYVLAEPALHMGVPAILRAHSFDILTPRDLPFPDLDRLAGALDYFAKRMYWRPAREIIGAFLLFTKRLRPAGILHLAAFNCGIEALLRIELMSLHRRLTHPPPFMFLVCDEHTQTEHVLTRVEAFLDIVDGVRNERSVLGG